MWCPQERKYKKGNIGIDVTKDGTDADLICNLGFDRIPLGDAQVNKVFCRDFLEHVPKAVFYESRHRLHYPIISLMNEIWRILKPGGEFESYTPCYPHPEVFQDPTHVSVWTKESMKYFSGEYAGAKRYGVRCEFEIVKLKKDRFYLYALLRKPVKTVV
jgi:SAM-dependent methyltransferase